MDGAIAIRHVFSKTNEVVDLQTTDCDRDRVYRRRPTTLQSYRQEGQSNLAMDARRKCTS